MKKIKAGIMGAAGYTGGELIRLLLHHPRVEIVFLQSRSHAGSRVDSVHSDLVGETALLFTDGPVKDTDVVFFCAGHGEAKKFLRECHLDAATRLIDIGNDFRLREDATVEGREFVYGLPEANREKIKTAHNVANPGCFATTIQLGLLPLASNGLLTDVYTTGITGSTGAGREFSPTSHFSWRAGNVQAYKTLSHQHLGEIGQTLTALQKGRSPEIHFLPWRGDFTRGIFVSSQIKTDLSAGDLQELYRAYYAGHPFTVVGSAPIHLKQVVNTNKCLVQLEKVGSVLVVHSILDNLLKGASGQAVQNMNLMFGLDERDGLNLKASAF